MAIHLENLQIDTYRGIKDLKIDNFGDVNHRHPKTGMGQVFLLLDRDHLEIEDCLVRIEDQMRQCGLPANRLKNNQRNRLTFEIESEEYQLNVIPLIIPFDEKGALETVLLSAIAQENGEGAFISEIATAYVNEFLQSDKRNKYLKKERLVTKAKLSAAISMTNPDRSTVEFNTLLMSQPWEKKVAIQKHFKILNEALRCQM